MYFEQQNLFSSLNQSSQDLKKMMDLSASNDDYILESDNFGKSNIRSNIQQHLDQSSFGQPKNAVIIDSQNQYLSASDSSSLLKNAYSKYEAEIKSLLPQIHSHLVSKHYYQFEFNNQQKLENYKAEISQGYQKNILAKIDEIKENINMNLSPNFEHIQKLKEQINHLKKPQKDQKKTLSPQQQNELIERTVSQIFNSEKLLNEIKEKVKPKVEERVRFILIRDLEKELTKCQNQIEDKIAEEREEFKQKRKIHWQQQAQNELKELAVEFQQLKDKKSTMEEAVKQKISDKQLIMKKYKQAVEKFKQSKELQKNIKQLQQKFSKGSNTKRNQLKSIEKKMNKRNWQS